MTHWFNILDIHSYRMMIAIYGEDRPKLEDSYLYNIFFDIEGNRITLSIDIKEFPTIPPKKWVAKNFNAVKIKLHLNRIEKVKLNGWIYDSSSFLSLKREGELIKACYGDRNNGFEARFSYAWINNMVGYRSDISDPI